MDVTTATPAQIDTEIARLNGIIASGLDRMERAQGTIERIDEVQGTYQAEYPWFSPEKRAEAQAAIDEADVQVSKAQAARWPLLEEFDRRGGWTRFYLVTNTGGHVHSSTACDTCFPTTVFAWLVDQSGSTHEALVEQAGSMACTVCFPDAPVDVLRRKGTLEAPEARAKREEREAAKQARQAAKIEKALTADGSEFRVPGRFSYDERFKTAQSAVQWVVGLLADEQMAPQYYTLDDRLRESVAQVRAAYVVKFEVTGEEYDAMVAKKVAAKIKRERG